MKQSKHRHNWKAVPTEGSACPERKCFACDLAQYLAGDFHWKEVVKTKDGWVWK